MPRVSISLLGEFEVRRDNRRVDSFGYAKVRALLSYLACESDRPLSRESLAGLLWPEYPEERARQSLNQALFTLRKALGGEEAVACLDITRHTAQFVHSDEYRSDVNTIRTHMNACRFHAHPSVHECRPCLGRLNEIADCYEGDFLGSLSLPDSPDFEEWALLQRERLHHQVTQALDILAEAYARQGDYRSSLQYARRLVALCPWRESAHRQVMRSLALLGERQEALLQYETCRRVLREELKLNPEPETRNLVESIREGRLGGEGPEPAASGGPGFPDRPSANTLAFDALEPLVPFVGRVAELDALCGLLTDPRHRLLSLVGPGGSGKTRLAFEAARVKQQSFPDGVYLVPLAALESSRGLAPKIAESLGLLPRAGYAVDDQIGDYLRRKRALLILDSFEQTLDGMGLVSGLLKVAPHLKVLLTSRARTRALGEVVFAVTGLAVSDGKHAASEQRYGEAVRLFAVAAQRSQPDFEVTAQNLEPVWRICSLLRGIPLAILLAASWVPVLTPAEIATRLSSEFGSSVDFLRADWQNVPARQQSIRSVLDHSWQLLTIREQAILEALSVFRGGFTYDVAQHVVGLTLWELRSLISKSFVCCTPRGRYEIHELTRQYAAAKLARSSEAHRAVSAQHSTTYLSLLIAWTTGLKGARQQTVLAEMREEIENARQAWRWAQRNRRLQVLVPAFEGLCLFYELQGRHEEALALCREASMAEEARGPDTLVLAYAWAWQARHEWLLGRGDAATDLLDRAEAAIHSSQEGWANFWSVHAIALLQRAEIMAVSDPQSALEQYATAVGVYQRSGDSWGVANALFGMASSAQQLTRHDAAANWGRDSLELRRDIGDRRGVSESLIHLGFNSILRGDTREGVRMVRDGTTIRSEIGDRGGVALTSHNLGVALIWAGDFVEAERLLERSVALNQDLGNLYDLVRSLAFLGSSKACLQDYEGARDTLLQSMTLARQMGLQRETHFALCRLGAVAIAEGDLAAAESALDESIEGFRALGVRGELGYGLSISAYLHRATGARALAFSNLREGFAIGIEMHTHMPIVCGLPALALLLCDNGDVRNAVEIAAIAQQYPTVGSGWVDDLAMRELRQAAGALDPDIVHAAESRGRNRDPFAAAAELLDGILTPSRAPRIS